VLLGPARLAAGREALGASRRAPIVAAALGSRACLVGAALAAFATGWTASPSNGTL